MLHHPSKYNMTYISNFLAIRNSATIATTSLPPSPSHSANNNANETECSDRLDDTEFDSINATTGKSFTIASILGLKKKNAAVAAAAAAALEPTTNQKSKELSVMNLSMHNSHNQNYQQHAKTAFSSFENDNRILANRIPMAFAPHHPFHQQHQTASLQHHHHSANFNQNNNSNHHNNNNNNNNNIHAANNNASSALQSLQQQFHSKCGPQTFPTYRGAKEQRNKSDYAAKSKTSLKGKRVRTIFTPEQLERLEAEFERQQYMVGPERLYLAHTLQLTEAQVKVWFQNRRIKWRKHHLEITQQRLAIIRQRQMPSTSSVSAENRIIGNMDGNNSDATLKNANILGTTQSTTGNTVEIVAATDTSVVIESELSVCTDSMDSNSTHTHDVEDL